MGSNWFLIISGIIAGLAITSALLGYLGWVVCGFFLNRETVWWFSILQRNEVFFLFNQYRTPWMIIIKDIVWAHEIDCIDMVFLTLTSLLFRSDLIFVIIDLFVHAGWVQGKRSRWRTRKLLYVHVLYSCRSRGHWHPVSQCDSVDWLGAQCRLGGGGGRFWRRC